ncbi:glycosyltransferase family 8 protein [Infundibulicybe gibba]|nr:glycosyltransferase family 8 protein [Infundibulicybe gibba]
MHLPNIFQSNSWPYAQLPTASNKSSHTQQFGYSFRIAAVCSLLAGAGIIWLGVYVVYITSPYTALDNYQHLCVQSINVNYHGPPPPDKRAVVTSLYSDAFAVAVAVLGHSVRSANVSSRLIMPYLEDRISPQALCIARAVGWDPLPLNVWKLDQVGIDAAVYLDADTLVRRNFDELFDIPFNFAAVPDVYMPGDSRGFTISFNAGVLVLRPSTSTFDHMMSHLASADFPLGEAEQSYLNLFFASKALRLPYVYNANLAIKVRSPEMWEGLKDEMRIVHYTMNKPFMDKLTSSDFLSEAEQRDVLARAAKRNHGRYAEEVGWWGEAYDKMMLDVGHSVGACYNA